MSSESPHRYRTRVIAEVRSHVTDNQYGGVINISADVIQMQTNKSVKGPGNMSLTLVPRKNYLNYIFPNDIINIYVDPGDGVSGFVRTMMGYVDRIDRSETTGENGQMSTFFNLSCTDLTKPVDRTDIYLNPDLSNRKELFGELADSNLAGAALRTKGIIVHGSPADIVEDLIELLLGFDAQWNVPSSYNINFVNKVANKRVQRSSYRIDPDALKTLGFTQSSVVGASVEDLEKSFRTLSEELDTLRASLPPGQELTTEQSKRQVELEKLFNNSQQVQAFITLKKLSQGLLGPSVSNLLSLDFIESMAVDGYTQDVSIWSQQGTLASILYGNCNEIVNELVFDLRPVAQGEDECFGDGSSSPMYSREPDELGINVSGVEGFEASVAAVQYKPAVIFREYPFSVVEGLDLRKYHSLGGNLDFMAFGPVFSLDPASEDVRTDGRHVYDYTDAVGPTGIVAEPCSFKEGKPLKHIDSVSITNQDVISANLGRADHEVSNLFAMYSSWGNEDSQKFILTEFLPIVTPISIQRDGLRVKEVSTKFAHYSRDILCKGSGDNSLDSAHVRKNMIRWSLMMDSWNQHNSEYLSGTIVLRGMPEIRAGYRLDWVGRNESYYVEAVSHAWSYPDKMTTTLQVSRGQRNDPFPAYIPPVMPRLGKTSITPKEIKPKEEPLGPPDLFETFQKSWSKACPRVTRGTTVSEGSVSWVSETPESLAAKAGVDLETYSLARCIVSEGHSAPRSNHEEARAAVAIAQCVINAAKKSGVSITSKLTFSTHSQARGFYGKQSGRFASTAHDPCLWHIKLAQAVISNQFPDLVRGSATWNDPRSQDSGSQGGEAIIDAVALLNKRINEGHAWIGNIRGISSYSLMFYIHESDATKRTESQKAALDVIALGRAHKSTLFFNDDLDVGVVTPESLLPEGTDLTLGGGNDVVYLEDPKTKKFVPVQDSAGVVLKGGGNRFKDGRLGQYFKVKDTRATSYSVGGILTPSSDENYIDIAPNADHDHKAEYAYPSRASRDFDKKDIVDSEVLRDGLKNA